MSSRSSEGWRLGLATPSWLIVALVIDLLDFYLQPNDISRHNTALMACRTNHSPPQGRLIYIAPPPVVTPGRNYGRARRTLVSRATRQTIISEPGARQIQSITVISFHPLPAICLLRRGYEFNRYHTPLRCCGKRPTEEAPPRALIKCHYAKCIVAA